ncbi:phage baseplate assembly protein V [Desulfocurvibacter africanus]|uniref:Phage baseplate assembly protein V n=1 Tax=Desulfocurvibacter africanus subsp. africanus str. Walvis Bay TaxID=690850 RepID=F3Z2U0_DESAF|nr:phage baseplate assembly protein V [Desulfocurvibacter africanus]EGJ50257.1 phage baseplate assembly protein V [Desulfocurvibacter africanus subsp. africanus str. Walvis Bay]
MDSLVRSVSRLVAPIKRRVELMVARGVLSLVSEGGRLQYVQARLSASETRDNIERFEEYGIASVPLPGCEAVLVFVGGDRGHGLCIGSNDRRYRPTDLQPGETCIYTHEGDRVHLKQGRIIEINGGAKVVVNTTDAEINASGSATVTSPAVSVDCDTATVTASASATIDAPATTVTGDLAVGGNVTAAGLVGAAGYGIGAPGAAVAGAVTAAVVQDASGTLDSVRQAHNSHTHTAPSGGGPTSGPSVTA